MKNLQGWIQTIAAVACGVLVLGLLGGDALAGQKPAGSLLWPNGAKLVVTYIPAGGTYPGLDIGWPLADGAHHYRLTVIEKRGGVSRVRIDVSPAGYTIRSDGLAHNGIHGVSGTYIITVTAYSGPDESVGYSESLKAQITTPR